MRQTGPRRGRRSWGRSRLSAGDRSALGRCAMRTLLLAVGAMAASAVVAVAGLVAVRWAVPLEVLRANNDVAGNYLQSLGTLYAVLLAFVVFVVWSQFDEARGSVEREANEIADLWRIARALPPHVRGH